ncbi:hypothetical protein [Ethanoligenens harbinense]|uniref:hypothetical protein n=1 Tax=Ethanoligenens harbinense TaxID=253239 RepID=UPI0001C521BF
MLSPNDEVDKDVAIVYTLLNGTGLKPVLIKTIVTTEMAERIAANYGVCTGNVLTGFEFIGEQIGRFEAQGKADSYVFGFEDSYGYLSGGYVRDKNAVDVALLICEMVSYYRAQGISLYEKLQELYNKYGYCLIHCTPTHLKALRARRRWWK